jgi:integrase
MHQLKRIPVKSKGTCISEEDMESILQFSPTMVHDLAYRLIFECGFRPHELLSIRVSDIRKTGSGYKNGNNETDRYDNGDISTKDAIALVNLPDANPVTPSRKNKTGGRVVPVIQNAEPLLRLAIEVEKTNGGMGRLFPWAHKHLSVTFCRMKSQFIDEKSREMNSEIGNLEKQNDLDTNSIQSLDTAFKMTKPHNISVSFRLYDFRHTAITNLYLTTLSDQIIRKMVGWTPSSKMPDVYVHIKEEHILKQRSELCLPKDDMNLKYHIHNKGSNGNRNRITNKFFA